MFGFCHDGNPGTADSPITELANEFIGKGFCYEGRLVDPFHGRVNIDSDFEFRRRVDRRRWPVVLALRPEMCPNPDCAKPCRNIAGSKRSEGTERCETQPGKNVDQLFEGRPFGRQPIVGG